MPGVWCLCIPVAIQTVTGHCYGNECYGNSKKNPSHKRAGARMGVGESPGGDNRILKYSFVTASSPIRLIDLVGLWDRVIGVHNPMGQYIWVGAVMAAGSPGFLPVS